MSCEQKKRSRAGEAVQEWELNSCYFLRRLTAKPIKPMPSRPSVAGSGTDTVDPQLLVELWKKLISPWQLCQR